VLGIVFTFTVIVGHKQLAGAVKTLFSVYVQAPLAVNAAVTFTARPFEVKLVKVTVCGLDVMANVWPFTFNEPVAGGVE